jgi:hypothetical protein
MQCRDERLWLWCRGEIEAEVVGDGQFILAAGAFATVRKFSFRSCLSDR